MIYRGLTLLLATRNFHLRLLVFLGLCTSVTWAEDFEDLWFAAETAASKTLDKEIPEHSRDRRQEIEDEFKKFKPPPNQKKGKKRNYTYLEAVAMAKTETPEAALPDFEDLMKEDRGLRERYQKRINSYEQRENPLAQLKSDEEGERVRQESFDLWKWKQREKLERTGQDFTRAAFRKLYEFGATVSVKNANGRTRELTKLEAEKIKANHRSLTGPHSFNNFESFFSFEGDEALILNFHGKSERFRKLDDQNLEQKLFQWFLSLDEGPELDTKRRQLLEMNELLDKVHEIAGLRRSLMPDVSLENFEKSLAENSSMIGEDLYVRSESREVVLRDPDGPWDSKLTAADFKKALEAAVPVSSQNLQKPTKLANANPAQENAMFTVTTHNSKSDVPSQPYRVAETNPNPENFKQGSLANSEPGKPYEVVESVAFLTPDEHGMIYLPKRGASALTGIDVFKRNGETPNFQIKENPETGTIAVKITRPPKNEKYGFSARFAPRATGDSTPAPLMDPVALKKIVKELEAAGLTAVSEELGERVERKVPVSVEDLSKLLKDSSLYTFESWDEAKSPRSKNRYSRYEQGINKAGELRTQCLDMGTLLLDIIEHHNELTKGPKIAAKLVIGHLPQKTVSGATVLGEVGHAWVEVGEGRNPLVLDPTPSTLDPNSPPKAAGKIKDPVSEAGGVRSETKDIQNSFWDRFRKNRRESAEAHVKVNKMLQSHYNRKTAAQLEARNHPMLKVIALVGAMDALVRDRNPELAQDVLSGAFGKLSNKKLKPMQLLDYIQARGQELTSLPPEILKFADYHSNFVSHSMYFSLANFAMVEADKLKSDLKEMQTIKIIGRDAPVDCAYVYGLAT